VSVIKAKSNYGFSLLKMVGRPFLHILPAPLKRIVIDSYLSLTEESRCTFKGWGLKTWRDVPWNGGVRNDIFLKANRDVISMFDFSGDSGATAANVGTLTWRHWNVSFAVRYALEFSKKKDMDLVECGVCDGLTAFFALRELSGRKEEGKISKFRMHLYDSWMPMRDGDLSASEANAVWHYDNSDVQRVKKNLHEFRENVIYHQGYIPESLVSQPQPPKSMVYLHIDLNSAKATLESLKFFYPRLVDGGVIIFDDYGSVLYSDTKVIVDKFFADKSGILMPLPTGQAIYFR